MIPYEIESGKKKRIIRRVRKHEHSWKRMRKNQSRDFEIEGHRPRVVEIKHKPLQRTDRNSF